MRGIGVAVITSTSGTSVAVALGAQRSALLDAEAVLLVDHDDAEAARTRTPSWMSAWVPMSDVDRAVGEAGQRRRAARRR